jgi:hypothetical protein
MAMMRKRRSHRPNPQRQTEPRYLSIAEVGLLLGKNVSLRHSRFVGGTFTFDQESISVPGSKTKASKAPVSLLPALADELKAQRAPI